MAAETAEHAAVSGVVATVALDTWHLALDRDAARALLAGLERGGGGAGGALAAQGEASVRVHALCERREDGGR